MTLLSKITEVGNSIIALNNTRAHKDMNNLSQAGIDYITNLASGSGIPKTTLNNMLTENGLTVTASASGNVVSVTFSGTGKYSYNNIEKTFTFSSTTISSANVPGVKYLAVGNGVSSCGNYTVSYTQPASAASGDLWYDLNGPVLKKFTTAWNNFDGAIAAKISKNLSGTLIVTKMTGYRMLDAVSTLNEVELARVPVGTVIAYMGTREPEGYLLMDGRTLSRTTYSALFSVIGTSQGAGDGSTTFNIADMTDGRYLMGSTVAGGSINQCNSIFSHVCKLFSSLREEFICMSNFAPSG